MRLNHKTTEWLNKRYLRLNNLAQYHSNQTLLNLLDRDNQNCHVGMFYDEMARRNRAAVERIGRELERRERASA